MVKLIAYALLFWKGFGIMSDMQIKRRGKGEGSTRLRKDGRYEYRYVAGKRPGGSYTNYLPLKPIENLNVKLRL